MKKALPLLLIAALLLGAACTRQPAPAPELEYSLAGTVQGTSKNAFSLLDDADGTVYIFATETAEMEVGTRGLLPGDTAQVFYTGTLQPGLEDAAQPVTVTRVVLTSEAEKTVSGTIAALEADLLDLDADGGTRYRFIVGDAELDAGLLVGDAVTLTYNGALDATQEVQPVGVRRVAVTARAEESVTGVVVDATMNTLSLSTTSGIRYAFDTAGAAIRPGPNGLILGDVAQVWYSGTLDAASSVQPVTVNRVEVTLEAPTSGSDSTSSASSSAPASSSGGWSRPASSNPNWNSGGGDVFLPELMEHFISGTVTSVDGSALQIESAGFQYLFSTAGASVSGGAEGLKPGDAVAVFYYGTLNPLQIIQTVVVTRVSITGWGGSAVQGIVIEKTDTNLTLQTADDISYRFNTRNAEVETDSDGIQPGDRVSVYYTGSLDSAKEEQAVSVVRVVER